MSISEENKRIAGTEEDFRKGYQDAYKRLGYRPTSVRYVDGYERGLYFRRIVDPDPERCDCYDTSVDTGKMFYEL